MIDDSFLSYIDEAYKEYEEYKKKEGAKEFTFPEFLQIVNVWKLEQILEKIEK